MVPEGAQPSMPCQGGQVPELMGRGGRALTLTLVTRKSVLEQRYPPHHRGIHLITRNTKLWTEGLISHVEGERLNFLNIFLRKIQLQGQEFALVTESCSHRWQYKLIN